MVAELERRPHDRGAPRTNLLVLPDNPGSLAFWRHLGCLPCPDLLCTKALAG